MNKRSVHYWILAAVLLAIPSEAGAQSLLHRADSMLTMNYRKGDIDTAYITRPATKWTVTARVNVSGAKIEAEGFSPPLGSMGGELLSLVTMGVREGKGDG